MFILCYGKQNLQHFMHGSLCNSLKKLPSDWHHLYLQEKILFSNIVFIELKEIKIYKFVRRCFIKLFATLSATHEYHTHTHTQTYIYIHIQSSTDISVSFYQNSLVWIDMLASRCWDRNRLTQTPIQASNHSATRSQ